MTHVLIIPSFYPHAGSHLAGVFFREQAHALRKRGLKVGVVHADQRSLRGGVRRTEWPAPFRIRVSDDEGVPTFQSTVPGIPKLPQARARVVLWQLDRLIGRYLEVEGVPDVVHCHGILWAGVAAVRAKPLSATPVVITAHSSAFGRGLIRAAEEKPIREALRSADLILAVSRALQTQLEQRVPGRQIDVVPNLVDTDFFTLAERSRAEGFVWLSVGALNKNKGHGALLRSFATAFGGRSEVHLRVVGAGPETGRLQRLARDLQLQDRVRFLGALSREEVRNEMHQADGFVLASRIETFGVVLIEALATGLPVVATRSGGPDEIVIPTVGTLVPVDDERLLGEAMATVVSGRDEWRRRASAIRAYAEGTYSEGAVTDLIVNAYEQVMAGGR
ncbi:MAG: glycosyltransferase [Acidimicrobiia bacterium]|nr:glycosyltransferase [Acidimicrobiia bacterium]